jgi:hypothetical protein
VTISEAIARHRDFGHLGSISPGSWISANFNVWIGAPEDNRSWDYLYQARNYYDEHAAHASEAQRKLAYEELLIAEGSDWNWWYGPEHHSANDRDFDELYRKHLSNVYQALGGAPPDNLAQPISGIIARPSFTPQTAYIHPRITGDMIRYFEWMGSAIYTADHRAGAMHGKQFLLDSVHAGIDQMNVYGRLDFKGPIPEMQFEIVVNVEGWGNDEPALRQTLRVDVVVRDRKIVEWKVNGRDETRAQASDQGGDSGAKVALVRNFEFRLPLAWLGVASLVGTDGSHAKQGTNRLRLRLSLWQNRLPMDALPLEGWIELNLLEEGELMSLY